MLRARLEAFAAPRKDTVKKLAQKNQYTYIVPPGPSANPYDRGAKRRVVRMGWMVWNIKSVLQISLYFVGI